MFQFLWRTIQILNGASQGQQSEKLDNFKIGLKTKFPDSNLQGSVTRRIDAEMISPVLDPEFHRRKIATSRNEVQCYAIN